MWSPSNQLTNHLPPTIYHPPNLAPSSPARLLINVSVCGCRLPNFSSHPSKAFRKSGSASVNFPCALILWQKCGWFWWYLLFERIGRYVCMIVSKSSPFQKKPGLLSLLHRYNYQSYRCPLMSIKYPIFDPQQRATQTCQPEATWPSCSSPPTYPDASAPISSVAPSGRDERAARLRPAWSVPEKWWWDDSKTILEKIDVGKTAMLKLFTNINQLSYIWKHLAETSVNWEKKDLWRGDVPPTAVPDCWLPSKCQDLRVPKSPRDPGGRVRRVEWPGIGSALRWIERDFTWEKLHILIRIYIYIYRICYGIILEISMYLGKLWKKKHKPDQTPIYVGNMMIRHLM